MRKMCFLVLDQMFESLEKAPERLTELIKDETLLTSPVFSLKPKPSLFRLSVSNKLYCFPS